MKEKSSVYAYGIIAPSTLLLLGGSYPKPDMYSEVERVYNMTGGEACNSSIVLAKLGVPVVLDGLWLGDNFKAKETIKMIQHFGIDTASITIKKDYQNVEEHVIADSTTRTIFANYGSLFKGLRLWNKPNLDQIQNASVVCLDPFLMDESQQAAKMCLELNKPYVTVDCHYDDEIAKNAHIIIISGEYRNGHFPNIEKRELFNQYCKNCRGTIIFTSANDKILYHNTKVEEFLPYQVEAKDTTGAGDSFRAGIIYGVLHHFSLEKTIAFASLLASYICQSFPGVLYAPTLEELLSFSQKQGYDFIEKYL